MVADIAGPLPFFRRPRSLLLLLAGLAALGGGSFWALHRTPVALAPIFSDGMVLQRDLPIVVWGTAPSGQTVAVRFQDKNATAVAEGNQWKLEIPPMTAGGPWPFVVQSGGTTLTLPSVYVGEVWLCAGQSNMEWPVASSSDASPRVSSEGHPRIRLLHMPHRESTVPLRSIAAAWKEYTPTTASGFSAAAAAFGCELEERLKVPIGLIQATRSATPAEAWMSDAALHSRPDFRVIFDAHPAEKKAYDQALEDYKIAAKKAKEEGTPKPERPIPAWDPSTFYNGMIAPLVPFTLRGVLWYQGESNDGRPELYRRLFPSLIEDWRAAWNRPDLPFLFVQLAPFGPPTPECRDDSWCILREAQGESLALPRTGMAVTLDVGDVDIHPPRKRPVGERLARLARSMVYGEAIAGAAPLFQDAVQEGAQLRIRFKPSGRRLRSSSGPLQGFFVAGEDHRFLPAQARIDADTVVLSSPEVPHPAAARYAWARAPIGTLVDEEGLPVSPFRTDRWPIAGSP